MAYRNTISGGTTGASFTSTGANATTMSFAGITANNGDINLSTDANAATVNVGTGNAPRTCTFGTSYTSSTTNIIAGAGGINATATGPASITTAGGTLKFNSGTGQVEISSDNSATLVYIASGLAAKSLNLGSKTGASYTHIFCGTGSSYVQSATGTLINFDSTGPVTKPLQPSFLAIRTSAVADVTGDGTAYTCVWNSEVFDRGSNFSSTTFTAPVTGLYHFDVGIMLIDIGSSHTSMYISLVTSNRTYLTHQCNPYVQVVSTSQYSTTASFFVDMDASDTAYVVIQVDGGTKIVDLNGGGSTDPRSWFGGWLVA